MSYKVSRDYPRLKQLLNEGYRVVCWVTYDWSRENGHWVTDIAEAKRIGKGEYMHYMVSVRGHVFSDFYPDYPGLEHDEDWMFSMWEKDRLQFVDIDPSKNTLDLERVS